MPNEEKETFEAEDRLRMAPQKECGHWHPSGCFFAEIYFYPGWRDSWDGSAIEA